MRTIRRMPGISVELVQQALGSFRVEQPLGENPALGERGFGHSYPYEGLYTLCDRLHWLLERIDLPEGVLVNLTGCLGAEHLGACIQCACCDDTGHTDTGCVTGNDVVTIKSAGAAATVDRVAEEREPDCDTHGATEVGAWEASRARADRRSRAGLRKLPVRNVLHRS